LKGQGMSGRSGAGDALITVAIAPHPHFKPEGTNLRLDVPLTLYEAVLGAKVRVPTLEGMVDLAIPAGTSTGRTFRLRAKGLPSKSGRGDLLATVKIVLPTERDPEFEEMMRRWRNSRPYHPRKQME
jgi:DnaJ-class molecular chaperone